MFPGKHQSCCNQFGQCERTGKTSPKPEKVDCNRLPLQPTASTHVPLPAVLPGLVRPAIQLLPVLAAFHSSGLELPPDPSPPDAQALHATFLI
jgi:hypothetical protein